MSQPSVPLSGLELRKKVAGKLGYHIRPFTDSKGNTYQHLHRYESEAAQIFESTIIGAGQDTEGEIWDSECPPFELSRDACEEFMKIVREAPEQRQLDFIAAVYKVMDCILAPGISHLNYWLHATPADLSNAFLLWREQG